MPVNQTQCGAKTKCCLKRFYVFHPNFLRKFCHLHKEMNQDCSSNTSSQMLRQILVFSENESVCLGERLEELRKRTAWNVPGWAAWSGSLLSRIKRGNFGEISQTRSENHKNICLVVIFLGKLKMKLK